jgi:glycosyltransferase involved in cell wall biosynthesis
MKIGVLGHGLITWGGGLGFALLITNALATVHSESEIHVFLPLPVRGTFRSRLIERFGNHDRPTRKLVLESFSGLNDRITVHAIDDSLATLYEALDKAGIDAAIPVMSPLSPSIKVPWVGYIYDFQHRCLPDFFTAEEIRRRDAQFLELATTACALVVNSKKVASDIKKYIPGATAKVYTMPFSPFLDQHWLLGEKRTVRKPSKPYFIICNQFWIHKDHKTALRAFAQIAKYHPDVILICTGIMNDYRMPDYLRAVLDEIDHLKIGSRVKLLGLLSKREQMLLLRNSLALIQPTLFEGGPGGGAVYDAVALGVPALVSNIEVNQEVDCGDVRFFEAGNPDNLARLMRDFLQSEPLPRPDRLELLEAGKARLVRCGCLLMEALDYARHN